jgi:hypothetical protein
MVVNTEGDVTVIVTTDFYIRTSRDDNINVITSTGDVHFKYTNVLNIVCFLVPPLGEQEGIINCSYFIRGEL